MAGYIGKSQALILTEIEGNSVETGDIQDGAVTDAKINGMSSSKLSGALPALDGSALTGIDSLPSQTGNSGKFLTTDGSNASWAFLGVFPFFKSDGTSDTISLTVNSELPFFKSDSSASNIALTSS